jgi:hypothetical protein
VRGGGARVPECYLQRGSTESKKQVKKAMHHLPAEDSAWLRTEDRLPQTMHTDSAPQSRGLPTEVSEVVCGART